MRERDFSWDAEWIHKTEQHWLSCSNRNKTVKVARSAGSNSIILAKNPLDPSKTYYWEANVVHFSLYINRFLLNGGKRVRIGLSVLPQEI